MSYIVNQQYSNQDATLFVQIGPVVGHHQEGCVYQQWELVAVGGNEFTVKNAGTGTYASVAYEGRGAQVVGSFDAYTWRLHPVPGGWYQITSTDGVFVWLLTGDYDGAPIALEAPSYTGKDAQWVFNPAS